MALATERRSEHRPGLGACIVEHNATGVCATKEECLVEAVEVGAEHRARAGEGELGPARHRQVPDQDTTVGVGERWVRTLSVGRKEHLVHVRREPGVRDRPAVCPPLLSVVADVLHVLLAPLSIAASPAAPEVGGHVPGLLAQCALHQQCRALEELAEVWLTNDLLPLLGTELVHLSHRGRRGLLVLGLGLLRRPRAARPAVLGDHGAAGARALGHL
mmetsp:Transcript_11334/g.33211  ORF Transcript_11334/g.33211 Transcript_11334/m.33211 type:complete len:217 (-) Transcript_11334:171-821(-)